MAFTEAQRVKIRLSLGYPDVFRASNPRLEDAIDVVGERPDTQAEIETILARIAAADTKVNNVLEQAGVKRVDEVEFFGGSDGATSLDEVRSHGRMWVNRLSIAFGVPRANDIFSGRGYSGDWWGDASVQVYGGGGPGSGGGMIPLG